MNEFISLIYQIPHLGLISLILSLFILYKKYPAILFFTTFSIYLTSLDFSLNFWSIYLTALIIFLVKPIRRVVISNFLISLIEKLGLLPKISETEKIALTSGSVWVDGELFSGKPNFKWIFDQKITKLSKEEQDFLDNEVEEICKMCVDYDVQIKRDLPKKVWNYLAKKKFFGMIIPKEYGGLGFSALAHSAVIEKLSSRSVPLAITTMVPNSLGPAELLLHYGTKEQQEHYLPRLADGRDLPCFALTETKAGSDATSITSNGVLFKDSDDKIKIRLNFAKRYITLGAYATVIGVAFQLRDPDKLLFENEEVGITCALIPNETHGIRQGRRHDPLATPFVNSPLNGENVIVDLDMIIGGKDKLGKGWKMLMECLAAGRGISLPSTASGGSKLVTRATSAYARIRKQFGISIGKFEGIEEVIARITYRTYALDAVRIFTASSVDLGCKPAVITAIAKYHTTEMFRQNINDGMDVLGGRAIIRGPRNILANAYFSTPISITVEGANIMTRSLIHFGQGAIMCHPYAYKEIESLANKDLKEFDKNFFAHIYHLFSNLTRSITLSLTRGHIVNPFATDITAKYQRKISWCSATFALLADIALARFGGNLKRKEKLNGRFGDILSAMYISSAILRKFINEGKKEEDEILVSSAINEQLIKAQMAIDGIYQNIFGNLGKILLFPFAIFSKANAFVCPTDDNTTHEITKNIIKSGSLRDKITKGIYVSDDANDNLGRIEHAFRLHEDSEFVANKIRKAIQEGKLEKNRIEDLIDPAFEKNIIDLEEKHILQDASKAILDAMEVDEYELKEYSKSR